MAVQTTHQRLLLRDWLITKLDNNAYRRSGWIDREEKIFCIPWMHQSRHDFDDEDSRIFEDWSRDSGYWKPSENTAQWKTRFRCAMSKSPYIRELKDISSNEEAVEGKKRMSFKVFQILDSSRGVKKIQRVAPMMQSDCQNPAISEAKTPLPASTLLEHLVVGGSLVTTDESTSVDDDNLHAMTDIEFFPDLIRYVTTDEGGNGAFDETLNSAKHEVPKEYLKANSQPIQFPSERKSATSHTTEAWRNKTTEFPNDIDDFGQIDIIYFGQASTTYRFDVKLRLYDRSDPDSKLGELFPRIDYQKKNASEKASDQVKRILDPRNIRGGLILEYDNGNIFATRHCLVQIFYSNFFHPAKSTKLSRHERTLIFNHKDFDASFEAYKNGSSKMPSSKVYLGFGRQWYFSEETRLPITAIVKSRRHQNLCDSVKLESETFELGISLE